jgi:hypothetical protein
MQLVILTALLPLISAHVKLPGAESFVVPSSFPTSVFSSYYVKPGPTSEAQPIIHDPVLNITFPLNLTDPKTIPTVPNDPVFYPKAISNVSNTTAHAFIEIVKEEIMSIMTDTNSGLSTPCSKCIAALVSVLLYFPERLQESQESIHKTHIEKKSPKKNRQMQSTRNYH